MGGLGFRSVSLLAPAAFLASAAGTRDLQDRFLSQGTRHGEDDPEYVRILHFWSSISGLEGPMGTTSLKTQSTWYSAMC